MGRQPQREEVNGAERIRKFPHNSTRSERRGKDSQVCSQSIPQPPENQSLTLSQDRDAHDEVLP